MSTIYALAILFVSLTMGLVAIAAVMMIMGLGGATGAVLFEIGCKAKNRTLIWSGYILAAVGQSFVVCAYSVFIVSALRAFSAASHIPEWPLWAGALFHSVATPVYAMKENPGSISPQHAVLGVVSVVAFLCFLIMAFFPHWISPVFGWVPFFESNYHP